MPDMPFRTLPWVIAVAATTACATPAPVSTPTLTATDVASSRNCMRETGSLLRREGAGCLPVAGRVVTREELEQVGGRNLGESLRRVVPY